MKDLLRRTNAFLAESCGWLTAAIMILLLLDLTARYFSQPISGVSEVAVFTMIAVIYLGQAHCEETGGHVKVTAFVDRMPSKPKRACNVFSNLVNLVAIAIFFYAVTANSIQAFLDNESMGSAFPLPTYPIKFIMSFSLLIYLLQIFSNFTSSVREMLRTQEETDPEAVSIR